MKNKKWIVLCAAVVVILAVLLIWKPFASDAKQDEPVVEAAGEQTPEQTPAAQPIDAEPGDTEEDVSAEQEEDPGAYMLEDGGDLIIVVPEDQESNGF